MMTRMPNLLLKSERWLARIRMILQSYLKRSGQIYTEDRIAEYRDMWHAVAASQNAEFTTLCEDVWEIGRNGRKTRIKNDILEFDNPVTLDIAGRKPLIYQLLSERGMPVPPHKAFAYDQWESAVSFLRQHPLGCVVKPANGTSSGRGVTTHILNAKELRRASILASLYCKELLIEPMIAGECYRLLVLDGRVIHAVCRRGQRLIADGRSTILELIQKENERLIQNGSPRLTIDRDCRFSLAYQHLSFESIPAADSVIIVKSVNTSARKFIEVRTAYNTDVTGTICGDLAAKAVAAADLLRSRFVGVDFITTDGSRPLEQTGGVINEVNTTPGLHHHYDQTKQKYPEIAPRILQALLESGKPILIKEG
jgi:D-alanine-D-alanine ligase-like ATP-grasp enzyme